ncbi:MAG: formyltransferase family protein, partial [Pseudomonadota bacterium]|nr:formyltransferase family protein [Pseudomonadota bacterium]
MKVIFMGSPDFATPTHEALVKSNHEILAVYSQPPRPAGRGQKVKSTPVHQLAQSHHLSVCVPEKLSPEEVGKILAQKPDLIVVVAYGLILPENLVNSLTCINLHPS